MARWWTREEPYGRTGWARMSGTDEDLDRIQAVLGPEWRPATTREKLVWEIFRHERFSLVDVIVGWVIAAGIGVILK